MNKQNTLLFKRAKDNSDRIFCTYLDKDANGDERIWFAIPPNRKSSITALISNIVKRPEHNLANEVHRFTHGNKQELVCLFSKAGMTTGKMKKAIEKVTSSCVLCSNSGRPQSTNKMSFKHVNKAFNDEVKADLLTVKYHDGKYEKLNIVNTSTGYGERSIVESRNEQTIVSKFEE